MLTHVAAVLNPLPENTPTSEKKLRDPDFSDTCDVENFGYLVEGFRLLPSPEGRLLFDMAQRYFTMNWVKCPVCKKDYNDLTPHHMCVDCEETELEAQKLQVWLGKYLMLSIGKYGIENYSFDKFNVNAGNMVAYRAFQEFDALNQNLFVYGPCGTGKTHLAGSLLREACAKGLRVKWATPFYINRIFRKRESHEEEKLLAELGSVQVLIIDDLGVGRESDFTLRVIYEILERRIAAKQNGLVITSNLDLDKLAHHFGDDRLTSRLAGLCKVIVMATNDDGRLKND